MAVAVSLVLLVAVVLAAAAGVALLLARSAEIGSDLEVTAAAQGLVIRRVGIVLPDFALTRPSGYSSEPSWAEWEASDPATGDRVLHVKDRSGRRLLVSTAVVVTIPVEAPVMTVYPLDGFNRFVTAIGSVRRRLDDARLIGRIDVHTDEPDAARAFLTEALVEWLEGLQVGGGQSVVEFRPGRMLWWLSPARLPAGYRELLQRAAGVRTAFGPPAGSRLPPPRPR